MKITITNKEKDSVKNLVNFNDLEIGQTFITEGADLEVVNVILIKISEKSAIIVDTVSTFNHYTSTFNYFDFDAVMETIECKDMMVRPINILETKVELK